MNKEMQEHLLTHTVKETAKHFNVSTSTIYKARTTPVQDTVGTELKEAKQELEIRTVLTDQLMDTLKKNTELREELEYSKRIIRKLVE